MTSDPGNYRHVIFPEDGPMPDMTPLTVTVATDGGPWAEHNMACPVCSRFSAVLDMSTSVFQPCWSCQAAGFEIRRRVRRWGRWRAFTYQSVVDALGGSS